MSRNGSIPLTHGVLVARAVKWLTGTARCPLALAGIASTREIPDAIGWCTSWQRYGSIVVECKTSYADFLNDKKKKHGSLMGVRRYFLTPPDTITPEMVQEHYPDHGLLHYGGRAVKIVLPAPERSNANLDGEIRLLLFGLIHVKRNLLNTGFSVDMAEFTKLGGGTTELLRQSLELAERYKKNIVRVPHEQGRFASGEGSPGV